MKLNSEVEPITITGGSKVNASGTGSYGCRMGKIIFVSINFSTTSALSSGDIIYTNLPKPLNKFVTSVTGGDTKGYRLALNTDGTLISDASNLPSSAWFNGTLTYIEK